jgi:hypothetical protein
MRNSAADGEMPTCILDIKFDHNDTEPQEWAATLVQAAWKLWRERMGLLVLLHGLADFDVRCGRICQATSLCSIMRRHMLYHSEQPQALRMARVAL